MADKSDLTTVLMVLLPGGYWVQKDLLDELRRQVMEAIPLLTFGVECKIQTFLRPDFWGPLSTTERRTLGRALAHLVSTGQVALRFAGCPRCNSKRYLRT